MSDLALLAQLPAHLRPRTYLEIGVHQGRSLRLALPGTVAVGVDPEPMQIYRWGARVSLYHVTSDEFFARDVRRSPLGGRQVDLALIDGMHLVENALRDFVNIERLAHKDTVVVLDDTIPPTPDVASREHRGGEWAGDVWKAVVALRTQRPDLSVTTFAAGRTGMTVVTGLDAHSGWTPDLSTLQDLPFAPESGVTADWAEVLAVLPAPFQDVAPWTTFAGRIRAAVPTVASVRNRLSTSRPGRWCVARVGTFAHRAERARQS